jgi:hypothetical protein
MLATTLTLVSLAGCQYQVNKRSHDEQPVAPGKFAADTKLDFTLVHNSVVKSCRDCHAGEHAPTLVTASDFRASMARVLREVDAGDMPPRRKGYAPLNDCQTAILHRWAELGSPDSSAVTISDLAVCTSPSPTEPARPTPAPEPPLSLAPLTYETALNRILKPKCLRCHNLDSTSDAVGTLFFPYEELASHRGLWRKPGANSKFAHLVTREDDERMPPTNSTIAPLSEEELDFMVRWIDAGIPE